MKALLILSALLMGSLFAHADDSSTNNDNVVEFHIPAGTGGNPWNTFDNPVVVKVGQTLRLINDDSIVHLLHTDGAPCPHGSREFGPGETYDCVIGKVHQANADDLYDHDQGPDAQFYVQANP
jgi:hypothetical protein